MEKIFSVQKNNDEIVLFNLKGMNGLSSGDIFFKRNKDNTTDILQEYEYLDEKYLNNIIDNLLDNEQYDFTLLESKSI